MNNYLLLAMIPFGLLMLPVVQFYNYATPRNEKLIDVLIKIQLATLGIQLGFLVVGVYIACAS